jgi:hypothetical protein
VNKKQKKKSEKGGQNGHTCSQLKLLLAFLQRAASGKQSTSCAMDEQQGSLLLL